VPTSRRSDLNNASEPHVSFECLSVVVLLSTCVWWPPGWESTILRNVRRRLSLYWSHHSFNSVSFSNTFKL